MSARASVPPPASPAGDGGTDRWIALHTRADLRSRPRVARHALRVHRRSRHLARRGDLDGLLGRPFRHRRADRPWQPLGPRHDYGWRHVHRRDPPLAAVPHLELPRRAASSRSRSSRFELLRCSPTSAGSSSADTFVARARHRHASPAMLIAGISAGLGSASWERPAAKLVRLESPELARRGGGSCAARCRSMGGSGLPTARSRRAPGRPSRLRRPAAGRA